MLYTHFNGSLFWEKIHSLKRGFVAGIGNQNGLAVFFIWGDGYGWVFLPTTTIGDASIELPPAGRPWTVRVDNYRNIRLFQWNT